MLINYQARQRDWLVLSALVEAKVTNPKGVVVMLQNIYIFIWKFLNSTHPKNTNGSN